MIVILTGHVCVYISYYIYNQLFLLLLFSPFKMNKACFTEWCCAKLVFSTFQRCIKARRWKIDRIPSRYLKLCKFQANDRSPWLIYAWWLTQLRLLTIEGSFFFFPPSSLLHSFHRSLTKNAEKLSSFIISLMMQLSHYHRIFRRGLNS